MRQPKKELAHYQTLNQKTGIKLPDKITALYCRLSKEEAEKSESLSIDNQRRILLKFCADNGFKNPRVFVDDGETGVFFDRPGLNEMLAEIRDGNVSTVVIKDQSRIGREVIEIGLLKRTFDEYNVRFLSAEDGLDTAKGFDIMSLLRDVFNEWFVADTSKKIRAVFRRKGMDGEPLSFSPPYGYKKNPNNPKQWIIDEPSAKIVQQIFQWCMEGLGPTHIAKRLKEAQVEIPAVYASNAGIRKSSRDLDPYDWANSTVTTILARREYLGHLINFKTYRKSYKNRTKRFNDPSEYAVFENAHPAIVEVEVFEKVQQLRTGKRRNKNSGRVNLMAGIAFCVDCNSRMYMSSGTGSKPEDDYYVCAGSRTKKIKCDSHFIRRVVLEQMVLEHIQNVTAFVSKHEAQFVVMLNQQTATNLDKEMVADKKRLAQSEKRINELDDVIAKLFEKNAVGVISDERFQKMSQGYEREQKDLEATVASLQARIAKQQEERVNVDQFLKTVRKYTSITELSPLMLNEMVARVEAHAREKRFGKTVQLDVHFNYLGNIGRLDLPPSPPPEKQPRMRVTKPLESLAVKELEKIPVMSTVNG